MKNPYDTLQANHRAPYHIWEATGKIEEAEAEIESAIKEMMRESGAYESDVIGELKELLLGIKNLVLAAEQTEKETLGLWNDHNLVSRETEQ